MAGVNKIINPGFGIGSYHGLPITASVDSTSTVTLTGTAYPTGMSLMSSNTGVNLVAGSAANGYTATFTVFSGQGGFFMNDGSSYRIVNTTTSVNVLIFAP